MRGMLRYIVLALGVITSGCSTQSTSEGYRFLVAGQSNSVSLVRDGSVVYSQTGLVRVSEYVAGDFTDTLQVPTQTAPATASASYVTTGDMIGVPVTFVNVSVGGTTAAQWRASLYQRILTRLQQHRVEAVLWGQGESDWLNGTDAASYYADLRWVIERSREVQPGLRWLVSIDSMGPQGNPVRTAQLQLIADGIAEAGPDVDALPRLDPPHEHFIGEQQVEHGRMWYASLKQAHIIN